MSPPRRGRALRLPAAFVLALLVALLCLDLSVLAPRVLAATDASIGLAVSSVSPSVATPGTPVNVQVSVTNSSSSPVSGVTVAAHLGAEVLPTRRAVREFGAGQGAPRTREVGQATVTGPIQPGRSASAQLTLPADRIPRSGAYGVYPLVMEAVTEGVTVRQRTYLPVHTRKEYEPLQLAFALPLTLGPDPALVTATGAELDAAWNEAAGPGSRVDRLLTATDGRMVTFAVDPTLVGYADEPAQPRPGTAGPAATPAESEAIGEITDAVAERLTRHGTTRVWELPPGDPDLVALTEREADPRLLASIASLPTDLPALLGDGSQTAPARIAWPAADALDDHARLAVDTAFTASDGGEQAAFVTGSRSVDPDPDVTGQAARRTPGGSPLLVSDDSLSGVLAGATRAADAGATTQRFLAESLTLLAESPGRPRTVLVTTSRSFDPDPVALRSLIDTATGAPWIDPVTADDLVTAAAAPNSPQATPRRAGQTSTPGTGPAAENSVPVSPLTPEVIERLLSTGQHIAGVSSVLAATDTSDRIPRASSIAALASARWRGVTAPFESTLLAVTDRVETLTTGVTVLPSTVNFLAEHGILQVTVVNNLDVAVQNVRLVLEPQGRTPRLRVTAPEPLSIAPGSRTTVRVSVDAVAAGIVPVSTYLTTATGTRLGTDATVNVRVQPTGGWIVTVGGVLVGLTFVVGLYRTFRRGRPRVTEADLEGIDLE